MLYLIRKKDESIIINEDIELKVVEIKGKSVKLGFNFPNGCSVLRKELFDKIQEEQRQNSEEANLPIRETLRLFKKHSN